ncbi:MAG: glycosyltransferase [Pseudomonadota bacterium]
MIRPTECSAPKDRLPHKERMALVLCSDANMFWQAAFCFHRHRQFDRDDHVDLYYYVSEPLEGAYREFLEPFVTIRLWDKGLPQTGYKYPPHITEAGLLRLFAIDELCADYDKVVYMDCDVFQSWGSFADLADVNIGDAPFMAIRDRLHWAHLPNTRYFNNTYVAKLPEGVHNRYFNSGILIANGQRFLDAGVSQKALRFLAEYPELAKIGDQSALNAVAEGNWLELSPSWNWQAALAYPALTRTREPRFIHLVGRVKPWKDKFLRLDTRYAGAMRDFLFQYNLPDYNALFDADKTRFRRERKIMSQADGRPGLKVETWRTLLPYLEYEGFVDRVQGVPMTAEI